MNVGTLTVRLVAQADQFERVMQRAQRTIEATARRLNELARQMQSSGMRAMDATSSGFAQTAREVESATGAFILGASTFAAGAGTMAAGIRKISPTAAAAAVSMKKASKAAKMSVPALIGVAASTILAARSAVNLASDMEQAEIAFTNMLGSAEAARDFLDKLAKFAERTPFEHADLIRQARQLMAFGFAAEEVIPTLTAVGDAVAAMGGGAEMIDRVTRALGQMLAKQRVSAEEMMQLTEAGIPAWDMLAEAAGKSVPEVMELAQKGLIPARGAVAALLAMMEKRFGGMMKKQMDTVAGATSNFTDTLRRFGIVMGNAISKTFHLKEVIKRLAGILAWVTNTIERMHPVLRSLLLWITLAALVVRPLGAAIGWLAGGLTSLAKGAKSAFGGLHLILKKLIVIIPRLLKGQVTLGRALILLVGPIGWVRVAIGALIVVSALLMVYWDHLGAVARAVWGAIGAAVLYAASLVVRGIGIILAGIGLIIPAVRDAAQKVLGVADSLKAAASQSLASARMALQAKQNQDALAKAGEKAAASQQEVAESMGEAAEAAADNIQSFDQVHQIQEEMASGAAPEFKFPDIAIPDMAVPNIGEQVSGAWQKAVDSIASAWDRLKAKALETFPWLQQVIDGCNRAVQWIKDNWPTIGPIIEGIAGLITLLLIPAFIKLGVEATVNAAKVVASWVVQGAQAIASVATQVAQFAILVAKWVWLGIQAAINAAKVVAAWVAQKIEAIASVAAQVAQFVILGAKWVWLGIVAMANAARMAAAWIVALGPIALVVAAVIAVAALIALKWDDIRAWTAQVWPQITGFLHNAWESIKQRAFEVWQAISDWVSSKWEAIRTATVELWTALAGWLSELWQGIKDRAAQVWDAMAQWISAKWEAIRTKTSEVWQAMGAWLGEKWASIKQTALNVWEGIKSTIADKWESISSKTTEVWNRITSWLSNTWSSIATKANEKWQDIKSWIATHWDSIHSNTTAIWNTITTWLGNTWNSLSGKANEKWAAIKSWIATHWDSISADTTAVWNTITTWLGNTWNSISNTANEKWQGIKSWIKTHWDSISANTTSVWNSITSWLSSTWQGLVSKAAGVWESIRSGAASAWQRVKDTILGIWDGIKKGIAACINRIIDALNSMIRGLNRIHFSIPSWVPIIGGRSWGFNLPTIPHVALAEGGEVTSPTFALLGERGPETVVPLGRTELAQEIAEAVYAAIRDALRIEGARRQPGQQELVLKLDGHTVARALLPALIAEAQRTGLPIIVRPAEV